MLYFYLRLLNASCNNMIYKVKLPNTQLKDITLDVTSNKFLLCSSKYYLSTQLSQTVDPKQVRAKWDSKKETLNVTLTIIREDE